MTEEKGKKKPASDIRADVQEFGYQPKGKSVGDKGEGLVIKGYQPQSPEQTEGTVSAGHQPQASQQPGRLEEGYQPQASQKPEGQNPPTGGTLVKPPKKTTSE